MRAGISIVFHALTITLQNHPDEILFESRAMVINLQPRTPGFCLYAAYYSSIGQVQWRMSNCGTRWVL
eukprot:5485360-Pyramimonas_sp.AAC.1